MKANKLTSFLYKYKYELLFVGLIQHLFVGILLRNMDLYARVVWALNMFILAIVSAGVFLGKGRLKNMLKNIILVVVLVLPMLYPFYESDQNFLLSISLFYFLFFAFIFYEVVKFLTHPGYINKDIISASACGFLLLLELSVFLVQFMFVRDPSSFDAIDTSHGASVFTDIVYFCSITLTTIGYGDISPTNHSSKLVIALLGWMSQFYSVFLVGILVGKFSSVADQQGGA